MPNRKQTGKAAIIRTIKVPSEKEIFSRKSSLNLSKVENYQAEGIKLWEFIAMISSISVLVIHQFLLLPAQPLPFVFYYVYFSFTNFNLAIQVH